MIKELELCLKHLEQFVKHWDVYDVQNHLRQLETTRNSSPAELLFLASKWARTVQIWKFQARVREWVLARANNLIGIPSASKKNTDLTKQKEYWQCYCKEPGQTQRAWGVFLDEGCNTVAVNLTRGWEGSHHSVPITWLGTLFLALKVKGHSYCSTASLLRFSPVHDWSDGTIIRIIKLIKLNVTHAVWKELNEVVKHSEVRKMVTRVTLIQISCAHTFSGNRGLVNSIPQSLGSLFYIICRLRMFSFKAVIWCILCIPCYLSCAAPYFIYLMTFEHFFWRERGSFKVLFSVVSEYPQLSESVFANSFMQVLYPFYRWKAEVQQ